jgi:hypothetical protein
MTLPRTRGAVSGLVLVLAGLWAALVPFFGPYLNLSIGTDHTWHWTTGRLWLDVLPGAVAAIAGLMLIAAATRGSAGFASWLAVCAGAWLIVGQSVSLTWNHGVSDAGAPLFGNAHKMVEEIVYYYGVGALILFFGAFALGRMALPALAAAPVAAPATAAAPRRRWWAFGRRRRTVAPAPAEGVAAERPVAPAEQPAEQPTAVQREP